MKLVIDPESRFSCSLCAACCDNPWSVIVSTEKRDEILGQAWDEPPSSAFTKGPGELHTLTKQADSDRCIFLDVDNLCVLHKRFGEASKPTMCQRFPFLHVASDEKVWVTASYGCSAVSSHEGVPLEAHRASIEAMYAKDLDEADPAADTVYPIRRGLDWTTADFDAALDGLEAGSVFETMSALVDLFWDEDDRDDSEGDFRYAFALTLYSDLVGDGFWGRMRGVFTLPRALSFTLDYDSRLIGRHVSMAAVRAHTGGLPSEGDALLSRWLRSRVRARRIFRHVPHAAAGITRLLLEANLVLFFARALANEGDIEPAHALQALRIVEQYVANQEVVSTLARLDPRLRAAWENPQVARVATRFFRSSSPP